MMKLLININTFAGKKVLLSGRVVGSILLFALLEGCGPAAIPSGINDPNEAANRRVHEFNKSFDRRLGGGRDDSAETAPVGATEGADPDLEDVEDILADGPPPKEVSPALIALSNFGTNLDTPRKIANSLLQLRPGDAAQNTLRFGVNSTIGIFGLIDVARAAGLPEVDTNFGETLHVWGVPEGAYQELPVVGPSTQRDTAGRVVDFALNPLWYVFPWPENLVANGFTWASEATDRVRYSETVDSLLYDSADSYAQTRLIYLQNRRFELSRGEVSEDDESVDLYEELYGD